MHEKAKRIKYIRVLEKFFKRNLSLLKLENFDYELYRLRIIKSFEELQKAQPTDLNSNYLVGLKRHIENVMSFVYNPSEDLEQHKQNLLKEANLLLKDKNQSNYKKEKHKNKKFDDGY